MCSCSWVSLCQGTWRLRLWTWTQNYAHSFQSRTFFQWQAPLSWMYLLLFHKHIFRYGLAFLHTPLPGCYKECVCVHLYVQEWIQEEVINQVEFWQEATGFWNHYLYCPCTGSFYNINLTISNYFTKIRIKMNVRHTIVMYQFNCNNPLISLIFTHSSHTEFSMQLLSTGKRSQFLVTISHLGE